MDNEEMLSKIKDLMISHLELKALMVFNNEKLVEIRTEVKYHDTLVRKHDSIVKIGAWLIGIFSTFLISHFLLK